MGLPVQSDHEGEEVPTSRLSGESGFRTGPGTLQLCRLGVAKGSFAIKGAQVARLGRGCPSHSHGKLEHSTVQEAPWGHGRVPRLEASHQGGPGAPGVPARRSCTARPVHGLQTLVSEGDGPVPQRLGGLSRSVRAMGVSRSIGHPGGAECALLSRHRNPIQLWDLETKEGPFPIHRRYPCTASHRTTRKREAIPSQGSSKVSNVPPL